MTGRLAFLAAVALVVVGCTRADNSPQLLAVPDGTASVAPTDVPAQAEPSVTPAPTATTPAPTPTPIPLATLRGTVVSITDGATVADATVSVGSTSLVTGDDGSFEFADVAIQSQVTVERPVWHSTEVQWSDADTPLVIELEPVVVKGLRVAREVAGDPERFAELLTLADETVVNTLVFDTKDESDQVLYETGVAFADQIGSVNVVYDPVDLLAQAKDHGLYTITRIVTFEDRIWANAAPEAKLVGAWVDPVNTDNWEYPLDLAVEACELGFHEIQFDYVRFPAGNLSGRARALIPAEEEDRSAAIAGFLGEARSRLHAMGCGVSAAIFGIVMSSPDDERLGQTPETVSAVVDAISPMLYPSHYSPGWLGFADPNDFPGPVVAYSLDAGADRMAPTSLLRPWLQGFYYNGEQVRAEIDEADSRGAGWIIWNVFGEYGQDWLPSP